ncbi:uncharacterized protein PV09_01336 [Verruconis gallopava]|uniref:F-box domain-containing protein n=1 Tax=Verruconis gallopava TaxID=253628 RepID=A0A0D2AP26_9PEZI|nr:uncharacterized protein PV09_01336 [Verruconis gallopava]KIW08433.1 hypothetical protein PV09_01336 [Verruconis gallopava]
MSSSAERVFRIVELLDLILANLALRDLLSAQRVNFHWHQVIKNSSRLQESKYLLPDRSASRSPEQFAITNPLYLQRFVQQAAFFALQQLNPAVQFIGMDRFVRTRERSFADPEANWRDMLLFQPPVRLALLKSMSPHYDDGYFYIENSKGLRMGDVVDFFRRKALDGMHAVELLSATATRKVVWSVMPATLPEEQDGERI